MTKSIQAVLLTAVASGALCAGAAPARAATYLQTDLVSDLSTLGAEVTDPNLKNSWGLSFQPGGPVWVSDQGTQNATIYGVTGATVTKESLTVAIPPSGPGVLGPTGQVANTNTSAFGVSGTGKSALFIFANLNGSISAWNGSAGNKGGHRNDCVRRGLHRARDQPSRHHALRRQWRGDWRDRRLQWFLCAGDPPRRSVRELRLRSRPRGLCRSTSRT